jgi:anti-sigma factor RsiW
MQHLDEGTIHTWLDGELPPSEREAVEAHIASCAQCAAAVAEARGFVAASSRILTALDSVPGGVLPATSTGSGAPRPDGRRRFVSSRAWMAAAAVLVLSTVTVIVVRPRGDTAQLQVAAATQDKKELPASVAPSEEKASAVKPTVAPQAVDSHDLRAAAPFAADSSVAAPAGASGAGNSVSRSAPTAMQSRAAAPADEPKPVDQNERLKSRLEAERQSTRVRESNSAPAAMADAASPPVNDSTTAQRTAASARDVTITGRVLSEAGMPLASASVALGGTRIGALTRDDGSYELRVPAARANGKTTSLVARLIGYKAAAVPITPDSAPVTLDFVLVPNPMALGEVVVTGAGTTTAAGKLGSAVASNEAPRLLSKSTSAEAGDTVVTTVYAVRAGTVTLLDRSSARDEARRQKESAGFSDQLMAKAREDKRINSITWSDSTGHTRTLRGAIPREDLERIRVALFGATP